MKKLYKYIMILFVGIVALSSCVDDNDVFNVGEGKDVVLKLKVQTQANKDIVLGRALDYENDLYDLHFYVFNANGNLTGYTQLTNAGTPTGIVNILTKTGKAHIYAVANINNGSTYTLDPDDKTLLNVTDVKNSSLRHEDFLRIKYKRSAPTGNQVLSPSPVDQIFMMSGYLNEGEEVTINDNGTIEGVSNPTIYLYRILAKNTFTIDLDNSPGFTPKSFELRNIPLQGMLVRNATYIVDDSDGYYDYNESLDKSEFVFYCPENKQGTKPVDNNFKWKDREANSYYTTNENGQQVYTGVKEFTNAPDNSTYVEIYGDYYNKTTETSTTTPPTTTITTTSANVSYSIHLGNFDFSQGGSYGDYNVIRNNHYKYKVIVNGVEDIIAEAVIENATDNDDNPYAEGLVIRTSTGQHYEVDAHYEARVMGFNMGDIWTLKSQGKGYILNIETPHGKTTEPLYVKYEDGVKIYTLSNNSLAYTVDNVSSLFSGNFADYDWMKFVKNTTNNKISSISNSNINKYPCRYPGDQWNKTAHSASSADDKPDQPWLNVFELLAELHNNAEQGNTETVYYTCFIDENYYANMAWADYVNKDPRKMQIANNLYVSHDKNSIYADVQYSISQRSIASFYNIDDSYPNKNSVMAFGTEIIDEEDEYNNRLAGANNNVNQYYSNYEPQSQHSWNGYSSAVATNIGTGNNKLNLSWYSTDSKSVQVVNVEGIQPLYKAAAKACMSRNRDLNGNGVIDEGNTNDESEVRWYLASVGQYHGLFFGKLALPVDSWLISDKEMQEIQDYFDDVKSWSGNNWNDNSNYYTWPTQNSDGGSGHHYRGKYHYYTSSPSGSSGTYWPEEGITNNPVRSNWTSRAEMVRCVRTLENNGLGTDNPTKYYTYNETDRTFDLYGIETRRDPITEGNTQVLPNHNELQPQNELYRRFKVASNGLSSTYLSGKDLDDITGASADPCLNYHEANDGGAKWRTPNQKELALMLLEGKWSLNNHTARTRFSGYQGEVVNGSNSNYKTNLVNDLDEFGYHWHNRLGYVINSEGNFNLVENTSTISIRCVRDVIPTSSNGTNTQ